MRVDAKVVMLGKESVGKTSLVERYVHHRFLVGPYQNLDLNSHSCPFNLQPVGVQAESSKSLQDCLVFNGSFSLLLQTIGAAFVAKPIQVGDKVITLGIWDTAGSERYEAMSRIYYRGARAAVVCYGKSTQSSQMTCEELVASFLINHPTANSRASS
ncbi:hypothetical protein GOODEAATRI_017788 [Goodea atripinnis]|uniref:Uncharacterized protein n=1 Tax=Goodea atripinnis TaxID=208336 RepID=A0ABV0NL39_9TELE